jgi:hypothetical protein
MKTPIEIAERTLANHAIRDDWRRNGAQIRDLIVEAIEADREHRAERAAARAEKIVYDNYGPDGDPEVYSEAADNASAFGGPVDQYLLGVAISLGHLDSDGILAMLREAAR